jgi:LPXTG-site transpeptidase (sortase) family protein
MPAPAIGVAKRVVSATEVSTGTWDVTYDIYVENFGNVALNSVQVTDDLSVTFPNPNSFTVQSITSSDLAENTAYNGSADINLLVGTDTLAVGANGTVRIVVRVVPAQAGPFDNTAVASGQDSTQTTVTDQSQDGTDPDPDNDDDPTNNNTPTTVDFGPNLFDPPFGLKVLDASGLPVLQWTMFWINDSNIVAVNAQVSDPIVTGTTFVPGSLVCTPSGVTTTTTCAYDSVTNRIMWSGNLGPDLGATDAASANNEITITFRVNVAAGITSVRNVATIDSDLNGNGLTTDPGEQQVASASARWTTPVAPAVALPATGFSPRTRTKLGPQPQELSYISTDILLEIHSLGVKIPIVGVPKKNGTWDVSWLGKQAGWLEGSAFPSWRGNSVLTSHVYVSNGLPGPFVNLSKLKYGDQIIVHAYGQKYIFEVQTNQVVLPTDRSAFQHEENPWLTLITCKEYDEKTNTYRKRVVVRAVLVKVMWEK